MDASIIVPVYNDPAGIRATLDSLLALAYPAADHEILVVDNGSTDSTREVARELTASHDHATVLVEDRTQSSYAARNAGIRRASGEILAFVDADMSVEETWLDDLVAFFRETDAAYVGCDVEVYVPEGRSSLLAAYSVAKAFPVEYYMRELQFAPTCCLSVDRAVIEDVGPFSTDLVSGGDAEFGRRVARAGYPQQFTGDITMYHPARTTLREHLAKAIRQGRGREQRHRQAMPGGRPWSHPRNVLPPHPGRFRERLTTDESAGTLLAFYLLTYLLKFGKLYGQLDERFR